MHGSLAGDAGLPTGNLDGLVERTEGRKGSSRWMDVVLDQIDYGLAVVEPSTRVIYANAAARVELTHGLHMVIREGKMVLLNPNDHDAFRLALHDAGRGQRSLLRVATTAAAQMLAVIPVDVNDENGEILVVFGKQRLCEPLSLAFYAKAHSLSHTESNVLQRLCEGYSPQEIASDTGVAISTVRTQIASIRFKTRVHSIRELISQVISLPPMMSALQSGAAPVLTRIPAIGPLLADL